MNISAHNVTISQNVILDKAFLSLVQLAVNGWPARYHGSQHSHRQTLKGKMALLLQLCKQEYSMGPLIV